MRRLAAIALLLAGCATPRAGLTHGEAMALADIIVQQRKRIEQLEERVERAEYRLDAVNQALRGWK